MSEAPSLYYNHQFVQNETIHPDIVLAIQEATRSTFYVGHKPVVPGTLVGTICLLSHPIQTFVFSSQGVFTRRVHRHPNRES